MSAPNMSKLLDTLQTLTQDLLEQAARLEHLAQELRTLSLQLRAVTTILCQSYTSPDRLRLRAWLDAMEQSASSDSRKLP